MFVLGPTFETDRLILRPPVQSDLDAYAAMMADEEAARFIGGTSPRSAVWRALTSVAGSWALMGFGMFSVIERSSGRWVGRLGPWQPDGWPGTEIGWGLARFVFDFTWTASPLVPIAGSLAGALLALGAGWWGLREVLRRPVVDTLRRAAQ